MDGATSGAVGSGAVASGGAVYHFVLKRFTFIFMDEWFSLLLDYFVGEELVLV